MQTSYSFEIGFYKRVDWILVLYELLEEGRVLWDLVNVGVDASLLKEDGIGFSNDFI